MRGEHLLGGQPAAVQLVVDLAVPQNSTRPAWLAARTLWVTIKMVWPPGVDLAKQPQKAVRGAGVQRAGGLVGQDQFRRVISARATAARCFCPPETS